MTTWTSLTLAAGALVFGLFAPSPVSAGDPIVKRRASDASNQDQFGADVAIAGGRLYVGASGDTHGAGAVKAGSVYVFDLATGAELMKLVENQPSTGDVMGASVAVDGAYAVFGAPKANLGFGVGSAFVFDTTTGQQLFQLSPPDEAIDDFFGCDVDVSGDLAVVGAYRQDELAPDAGAAYVFDLTTGQLVHKLLPDDGGAQSWFGWSVAIDGDDIAVGMLRGPAGLGDHGVVYLFDALTGAQVDAFTASDAVGVDHFGSDLDLDGGRLLVGAQNALNGGGKAYLFDVASGTELHILSAPAPASGDKLGHTVSLSGGRALVGAPGVGFQNSSPGAAFLFDAGTGALLDTLTTNDAGPFDFFGSGVAVSGDVLAVGAPNDDVEPQPFDAGSVYVYDLTASGPWMDHTGGVGGGSGVPSLVGTGDLTGNSPMTLALSGAPANATTTLVLGLAALDASFKQGVLLPRPDLLLTGLSTDGAGALTLSSTWPAGVPSAVPIFMQQWSVDATAPKGFAASNGLSATTP